MDYEVNFPSYVYELDLDDVFEHEGEIYRALYIQDDDMVVIHAEWLTGNDDTVTLELDPNTKVSVLTLV